jgi:hypothetical protein
VAVAVTPASVVVGPGTEGETELLGAAATAAAVAVAVTAASVAPGLEADGAVVTRGVAFAVAALFGAVSVGVVVARALAVVVGVDTLPVQRKTLAPKEKHRASALTGSATLTTASIPTIKKSANVLFFMYGLRPARHARGTIQAWNEAVAEPFP